MWLADAIGVVVEDVEFVDAFAELVDAFVVLAAVAAEV